jgi:NADPH-dependent 2,4-dienoyl-CoA reductase/sulfur reductase-like enzyme
MPDTTSTAPATIVVVGAGLAGVAFAEAMRRGGSDRPIVLVNGEDRAPYDRPPLSKDVLTGARAIAETVFHPDAFYDEHAIRRLDGVTAVAIDPQRRTVALSSGETLPWGDLVLATGAAARDLTAGVVDPAVVPRVHRLRDAADAERLRAACAAARSMVVVGAGFVGLEVAASARGLGLAVTVVEAADRPVARGVPTAVSAWLTRLHESRGVRFVLGRQVRRIEPGAAGARVVLDDGTSLEADVVVVGIGATPNDGLARAAGLPCDDGILVDADCRTAHPNLWAIGDVARPFNGFFGAPRRLEHWEAARRTAETAAAALCGRPVAHFEVPWVWTDQYDVNLQFVGTFPEGADVVTRGAADAPSHGAYHLVDGRLVGAVLINAGGQRRPLERMIAEGAQPAPADLADPAIPLKRLAAK